MAKTKKTINFADYFNMYFDSARYVWKNKLLWLLGIIGAFFGMNSGGSGYTNFNSSSSSPNLDFSDLSNFQPTPDYQTTYNNISTFLEDNFGAIMGILIACVILYILNILIGIIVKTAIRAGLIKAGEAEEENKKITFKYIWASITQHFVQALMIGAVVFVANIFLGIISLPLMCCICIEWIAILVAGMLFAQISDFTYRLIILENKDLIESIKISWNLIFENLNEIILYFVSNLIISIATLILLLFFIGIPVVIIFIAFFMGSDITTTFNELNTGMWILLGGSTAIVMLIGLVTSGFILATSEIYKTKFFKRLMEISEDKVIAPKNTTKVKTEKK